MSTYVITCRWLQVCLGLMLLKSILNEFGSCPDPGVSHYGVKQGNCCVHGDILRYECKEGYELVGKEELQCLINGSWTSKRPLCRPLKVSCILPPSISHGYVKLRKCAKKDYCQPWDEVTVICDTGYSYTQPSIYIMCESDGQWEEVFGNCTVPECPDPGMLLEGKREGKCCYPGNILHFSCNEDYKLLGEDKLACQPDRTWSSEIPQCRKKQCPDPGIPTDGERNGSCCFSGDILHFSCIDGYDLEGENKLECLLNESWSSAIPSCAKNVSCPDPKVSKDGERHGNCCIHGAILRYECKENYELVGEEELECLTNGSWTSRRPLCRPYGAYCDLPPSIANGYVKLRRCEGGDYCLAGQEVKVVCKPGYTYNDTSIYILCQKDGMWDNIFGNCIDSFCNSPDLPLNGSIIELEKMNMTRFPYGFHLTYVCDKNLRILGPDNIRFCQEGGWSGEAPFCSAIQCPDPGIPEHGRKLGHSFEVGDNVEFVCDTEYTLIGSPIRSCKPNGQWSGELTRCDIESNYCQNPGIPINGFKNSSNYDLGAYVGFSCRSSLIQLGSETRVCLHNRTWSGKETKCLGANDFDDTPDVIDSLQVILRDKAEEQEKKLHEYEEALRSNLGRAISVDPTADRLILYFLFDVSGSIGRQNFKRSIDFAKAIVKNIDISLNGARAAAITFSSKATIEFHAPVYNTTEDVVRALDRIEYTGGATSANSALELLRKNVIPLSKATFNQKRQKSIVFILTDGRANIDGDPQEEANALKADLVEIFCIGITGSIRKETLYMIASDEAEKHVFILDNYDSLHWLVQEIYTDTIDYSRCGQGLEKSASMVPSARLVGGNTTVEQWPWMVAFHIKSPGANGQLTFTCGGSIINQYFILTAAHCLFFKEPNKDYERYEVDSIVLKLGLTNLEDKTHVPEPNVKDIFIHPKYEPKHGIKQHDIALLLLSEAIEFKQNVRPVCLVPKDLPDNSIFYNPTEFVVAIGWGHQGVIQYPETSYKQNNSKDLKQISLSLQPPEKCFEMFKKYKIKLTHFADNMFCAGDGKGGYDACKGDSGGPVMQYMEIEGHGTWTQVGVVSFGFGCGLPKTYGVYSHVSHHKDWIDKIIQDKKPV